MEENQENNEKVEVDEKINENETNNTSTGEKVSTENDLKNDTLNSFNEAKEQMKNINFKKEAEVGKGLLKKIWKDPIGAIEENVKDEKNEFYKTALLLIAVWAIIVFLKQMTYYATSKVSTFNLLRTIKVVASPICQILAMTFSIYILNKKSKKSLSKVITSVTIAKIPSILSSLLGFLTYISSSITYVTSPLTGLLSITSIALMFFTVKGLFEEENNKEAFKDFIKVEGVYYIFDFILSFLGISI